MKFQAFNRKEYSLIVEVLKILKQLNFVDFIHAPKWIEFCISKLHKSLTKKKNLSSSILQTELSLTQKEKTRIDQV